MVTSEDLNRFKKRVIEGTPLIFKEVKDGNALYGTDLGTGVPVEVTHCTDNRLISLVSNTKDLKYKNLSLLLTRNKVEFIYS
jgi:hypothetical protein